jgi:acyl-CoA-binding protein
MNRKEMNAIVSQELKEIPKQQSLLRDVYTMFRRHSLGKKAKGKKSAADVLQESIEFLARTPT